MNLAVLQDHGLLLINEPSCHVHDVNLVDYVSIVNNNRSSARHTA